MNGKKIASWACAALALSIAAVTNAQVTVSTSTKVIVSSTGSYSVQGQLTVQSTTTATVPLLTVKNKTGTVLLQMKQDGTLTIPAGAIDTAKIGSGAVDSTKLAANAVQTANIANGAVDTTKLGAGAVDSSKFSNFCPANQTPVENGTGTGWTCATGLSAGNANTWTSSQTFQQGVWATGSIGNMTAYPVGWSVLVSSFDAIEANGGVGAATMTVVASTGSYDLEFFDVRPCTSTDVGIRFNGDTGNNYFNSVTDTQPTGTVTTDSGNGVARCLLNRSGPDTYKFVNNTPIRCKYHFDVMGTQVSGYATCSGNEAGGLGQAFITATCNYATNTTVVTAIQVRAMTNGGCLLGHWELWRRY